MESGEWQWPDDRGADRILDDLSARQHLNPHLPVEVVLSASQKKLGFCPAAAAGAVEWLRMDKGRAIGRLRRAEVLQLAHCVERLWRRGAARNLHTAR